MSPFSRRKQLQEQYEVHQMIPSPDELLAQLPDDRARAIQCQEWAAQTRAKLFQGQREVIGDMLLSNDLRYRRMDAAVRTHIGKQKWNNSLLAMELLKMEEMYSRWAREYATFAQLRSRSS